MKKITTTLLFLSAFLMPTMRAQSGGSPTEGVLTSEFVSESEMKADLLQMLADFSLYMKNNWNQCVSTNSINESCGYFSGEQSAANNEQGVRPNADLSMICAFLMKYGKPAGVALPNGVSWNDIEEMAMKSLIFAYSTHKANKLKVCSGNTYWGSVSTSDHVWESSLWAMSVAYSAFFQWDKLSENQKGYVKKMLTAECNYELSRSIPTGFAGDTKAEENGWEADILAATLGLFPDDELAAQWYERMRLFAINSYSHATDAQKPSPLDPNYNGYSPSDLFKGKNLYDDYTLQNHNMFHTSYQNVVMQELGEAALALKMFQLGTTGTEKWKSNSLMHNNQAVMDNILNWLATADGELAMPNGNDWSLFLFDQITSYSTQACFNRDRNALLLENLAYKNIKARQSTTRDGSWLLRPDVAQRRMGVEAHRVMMTYLMHDLMPTSDLSPLTWDEFREKHSMTKYFPAQNIIRNMSKDRFTCFSWNTSLPDYSGVIVPNSVDKAKIMVPFRTHHTGNLLGVYSKADYNVSVPGRYAMYPDAYAMNGVVTFNSIPQAFCLYATSGNAVILIDALKATSATTVSSEQGGMMGISVDEFTKSERTIYYQGGSTTTNGSSYSTWTSPWSNIDNYLGFVVTNHGETITGAFGDRSNNNSIMTAKIYPSYNGSSSSVGTSMNHIRGFVYYTGVTASETHALSDAVVDLTTQSSWPEGWHGLLVPDPDGTYYLILSNLFADDNTPWEDLTVSCPQGAPVFTQVTAISGKNSTSTFYCVKNFNIANELKIFIQGAKNLKAIQEDGNSRAAYLMNEGTSPENLTITIIDNNGIPQSKSISVPASSSVYVDLYGNDIRLTDSSFPGNYRNVAYGKSVDANSYDGAHLPFATIDNDGSTYYKSLNNASSGTEYLSVNLRNNYSINKITVKPQSGQNGLSSVIASYGTTEGSYTAIPGVNSTTDSDGTITLTFNAVNASYVKLQLLGSSQVAVNQIGIYGEESNEKGNEDEETENLLKKNPSFEEDDINTLPPVNNALDGLRGYTCAQPTGWTISGTSVTQLLVTSNCYADNNFGQIGSIPDGSQAYYLRQGWSNGSTTLTTSETLPAGTYRLSCNYKSGYANSATSSFTLSCCEKSSNSITFNQGSLSNWQTATVDFTLSSEQSVNATVTINWVSGGSCVMFDNFRIEKLETNDQSSINKANLISNSGDATFLLSDPTCEETGKWKNASLISWLAESWRGGGVNGYQERTSNGTIYQQISNMPAGTYKLVAALRANTGCKITPRLNNTSGETFTGTGNNNTSVAQINTNGIQMPYDKDRGFASQNSTCRGWQWGSVTANMPEDGTLTVAFDMAGNSWMSIDDVHLYYITDGTTTYYESVKTTDTEDNLIETTLPLTCDIILANPNTLVKSPNPIYTPSGPMNNNMSEETINTLMLYDGYSFRCDVPSFTIGTGSYMRQIPTDIWDTVILPYEVSSNEHIQFYALRSVNSNSMYFEEVDKVPANTPVVFRCLQPSNSSVSFPSTNSNGVGTDKEQVQDLTSASGWTAYGNYDATHHLGSDETSYYIFQDKLWLREGGLEVNPFRSYFTYDGDLLFFPPLDLADNVPTKIEEVPMTPHLFPNNMFYRLSGQRVTHPTNGIYIINGKKILIK